jgi:transposase
MKDITQLLERWQLDVGDVRERMYRAPTSRERERWHALWLLAQGWSGLAVAQALDRDPHTIGKWVAAFSDHGPTALAFEQSGGSPPPSTGTSRPN